MAVEFESNVTFHLVIITRFLPVIGRQTFVIFPLMKCLDSTKTKQKQQQQQ